MSESGCWRRYGAYEVSNDPGFSRNELSLIDRGFVYAIAHVRGGGEMGRQWYEVRCCLGVCTPYTSILSVSAALRFAHLRLTCAQPIQAGSL